MINGSPTNLDTGQSTYTYDALDQLKTETRGGLSTSYTYDAVGNRLTKAVDGAPTTSYDYDAANELNSAGGTTYAYDANGSRVSRTLGSDTTNYTFNSDNLLTDTSSTSTTTHYVYDGENQRIAAVESGTRTDFVLDTTVGDEVVLQEATGSSTATYTYGAGLISRETSSGIRYLLADGLGSVRLETDASGAIVREHSYDAYGIEQGTSDLSGNRFRFTGQWSDGTGLVFLRARFYDPETSTFLSVDPVPSAGSRYVYCGNNPLLRVDPSGMISWSSVCSFMAPGLQGLANFAAGWGNLLAASMRPMMGPMGFILPANPFPRFHGPGLTASYYIGQGTASLVGAVAGGAAAGAEAGAARAAAGARSAAVEYTQEGELFVRVGSSPRYLKWTFESPGGVRPGTYAFPKETFDAIGPDAAALKNLGDLPDPELPLAYRLLEPPAGTPIQRGIVPGGEFGGEGGVPEVKFPEGF